MSIISTLNRKTFALLQAVAHIEVRISKFTNMESGVTIGSASSPLRCHDVVSLESLHRFVQLNRK
jgi:hypothetical protein